jgi:hypothetical protein
VFDLSDLKARVDSARESMETPPEPGEPWPIMPVTAYLSDEDTGVLWKAVRAIRNDHAETFNLYPETSLATSVIAVLGDLDETPTLEELAMKLREDAEAEGPWLISTALANFSMSTGVVALGDEVVLQRAFVAPKPSDEEYNAEGAAHFEVFDAIGDYINPPARWLHAERSEKGPIDTARTAALLTVEKGTPAIAASRARTKALYAIAVWTILTPPEDLMVLPDVGTYGPQPSLRMPQRLKEFDPGEWISKKHARAASIEHWQAYAAPDAEVLALPFEALEVVREKRSAQALLSACLAIFQAARGSRFLLTERLRFVLTAIEALGEPRPGKTMKWKRWQRLSARHGIHQRLEERGYTAEEVSGAEERLKTARNIATHGSDAVLIDLGFPEGEQRALRYGPPAAAEDLGFPALSADLTIMIFAVQHVLSRLLPHMKEHDWDEEEFQLQFKAK